MSGGSPGAAHWRRGVVPSRQASSWVAAVVCASVTAAMNAAAIRPWGLGALALVAAIPAFLAISRSRTALGGGAVAALASLGVNSVAYEPARVLFPAAYPVALAAASVPYLLVGACAARLRWAAANRFSDRASRILALAALPVLWVAAEWLPAQPAILGVWALPLGFVGYSQVGLPTAAVARLGSVAAVSLLVLAANASLAAVWLVAAWARAHGRHRSASRSHLVPLTVAALFGVVWAAGEVGSAPGRESLEFIPSESPGTRPVSSSNAGAGPDVLSIRIVQPNFPDSAYYAAQVSPAEREAMRRRLGAMVLAEAADLVVLPEAAWPGAIDLDRLPEVAATVGAVFGGSTVMFGAPARHLGGAGGLSNSVFLWGPSGLAHVYAKRRMVPIAEASLRPGSRITAATVAGVRVAPLVCYDALFPSDVRAAATAGAQVIVVVTDDAFAAVSDVPELHLTAVRMRAIEVGLPVVLASNTGPSALIAADGRVVSRLEGGRSGTLSGVIATDSSTSSYARHGDWLGGTTAVAAGGLALVAARGGSSHKRPT